MQRKCVNYVVTFSGEYDFEQWKFMFLSAPVSTEDSLGKGNEKIGQKICPVINHKFHSHIHSQWSHIAQQVEMVLMLYEDAAPVLKSYEVESSAEYGLWN